MKTKILKTMVIAGIAIFAGYNVYLAKAENNTVMSDIMIANVEALAQGEGGNTNRIYCCGNYNICMIVYDMDFNRIEVAGLPFSTPCPK